MGMWVMSQTQTRLGASVWKLCLSRFGATAYSCLEWAVTLNFLPALARMSYLRISLATRGRLQL